LPGGVVAFLQEIDLDTDGCDEPVVLDAKGALPAELTGQLPVIPRRCRF